MAKEFTSKSGVPVVINIAPWSDAKYLKMAIEREIGAVDGGSLSTGLGGVVSLYLRCASSPSVDAALMKCLARCLYNNEKVVDSTFDSEKGREDYMEIVIACVEVNLRPLFESLTSKLSEMGILKKQAAQTDQT